MKRPYVLRIYDGPLFQRVKERAAADSVRENIVVERALYAYLDDAPGMSALTPEDLTGSADLSALLQLRGIPDDGLAVTSGPDDGYRGQPRTSDAEFLTPGTSEHPQFHGEIPVRRWNLEKRDEDLF